ncbi:Oidioi.mRNA.OKI2018_I69.PAR.g9779.t1.cds [Oikopleura dioica]|uniref:Oidioi.mRNA.OKI2018_I69.PAR.g9779.t1.cds n=1 Tax=Oikopleura dioica TaxID=34765 RepID=A0ABN7RRB9_OIKDI|nr:Oidioi.mRNA.OKI2018_I69.PAR.g9779.t1.cds [Oikopleura dioica]
MKLFSLFLLSAEALKYKEVLQAYKESPAETGLGLRKKPKKPKKNKGSSSNASEFWEECPPLRVTGDIETFYCEDNKCMAICKANSQPYGNSMLTCVKGKRRKDSPYWSGDQPQCITCGGSADLGPPLTDKNIEAHCTITKKSKNMKLCNLQCTNGGRLYQEAREMFKNMEVKCICLNGECFWGQGKKTSIDTESLTCKGNKIKTTEKPITTKPPKGETTTTTVATTHPKKPKRCVDLGPESVRVMNTWVCRNCFRINASYKFRKVGLNKWDPRDFLIIEFNSPVEWTEMSHPILNARKVNDYDDTRWRVNFKTDANYKSGMKFDANLMQFGFESMNMSPGSSQIKRVQACPYWYSDY